MQQQPGAFPMPSQHQPGAIEPRRGRPLAIIGIAVAALSALLGPANALLVTTVLETRNFELMGMLSWGFAIVGGVLAVVMIGLGVASLLRREPARALAGAAIGIGAAGLVGIASSGLQQLAYAGL